MKMASYSQKQNKNCLQKKNISPQPRNKYRQASTSKVFKNDIRQQIKFSSMYRIFATKMPKGFKTLKNIKKELECRLQGQSLNL